MKIINWSTYPRSLGERPIFFQSTRPVLPTTREVQSGDAYKVRSMNSLLPITRTMYTRTRHRRTVTPCLAAAIAFACPVIRVEGRYLRSVEKGFLDRELWWTMVKQTQVQEGLVTLNCGWLCATPVSVGCFLLVPLLCCCFVLLV